jgi:hypothetical protein
MGTKKRPGQFDCYAKAELDEPMFVLLGRDASAPAVVRDWADRREFMIDNGQKPESDRAMVTEARECATAMEVFRASRKLAPEDLDAPPTGPYTVLVV